MDTIIAVLLGVCLLALPFVFLYLLLRGAARNKDTRERVEALEAVVKTLRVQVDALRHPPDPRPSPQPILAVPVAVHEEPLFVPPPVIVAPRVVEAIHEMTPDDVVEDDILENDVDDLAEDEIEETPIAVQQMADETTPRITWRERLGGTDWEALVGGNWLNKAGVLVFVIGLSLFLGYSLTRFGPAGRSWRAGGLGPTSPRMPCTRCPPLG